MYVRRSYSNEKSYSGFCMEDGTELKSSCRQLLRQTVKDEPTGVHAGRHGAFVAACYFCWLCYFCWFLFIVRWTLKKDEAKMNKAFSLLPLFLGGKGEATTPWLAEEDSSWESLQWVLDFMCWDTWSVPRWDAGTRQSTGNQASGRGWSTRSCSSHVRYAQSLKCLDWQT